MPLLFKDWLTVKTLRVRWALIYGWRVSSNLARIHDAAVLLPGRFRARLPELARRQIEGLGKVAYHQPRIGHMRPLGNRRSTCCFVGLGHILLLNQSCAEQIGIFMHLSLANSVPSICEY